MMSESRLQTICEQAVQSNPDIILLTGDFYTVEAYERSQHVLANAIAPLKELGMQGKVFACDGVSIISIYYVFFLKNIQYIKLLIES